jgi:hypothetical protein
MHGRDEKYLQKFNSKDSRVVAEWLAIFFRVVEVPGSNLNPEMGNLD